MNEILYFLMIIAALFHLSLLFSISSPNLGIFGCFAQLVYFHLVNQFPKADSKMIFGACG